MTITQQDAIDRQAMEWAIRIGDPAFADWDAFTDWLTQDPKHPERYDRIETSLRASAEIAATLPAAPVVAEIEEEADSAPRWGRRRWLGAAMAAALTATIGLNFWNHRSQSYQIETAAGQQRTVNLTDGSAIVLAGGSRVTLDRAAPRTARIETGAALFRVRHDAAVPFAVHVAGVDVVDVGTVFDISRDAGITRVAVAEGAVIVDPKGAALRLDPGQAVQVADGRLERREVLATDVGRWREDVLRFDDAPLSEVASALTRTLPVRVKAAGSVSAKRFRGTLNARHIANDPVLLGRLLDVTVRRTTEGWRLEPLR
jgi:transmembrane sensor